MGFKKGHKLAKGRPEGSKNKRTLLVEEIAAKFKLDPFEVLMMVAAGDWKALGYDSKTKTAFTAQGIEVEEDNVTLTNRVQAAKEAAKYLYAPKQSEATKKAVEAFEMIISDYSKK